MYYEFSEFYKRDVYFAYNNELNPVNWLKLREGKRFNFIDTLIYDVDVIDVYINKYDILPTFGSPLVSERFKITFQELIGKEIELYSALIIDKNGNKNFSCLNILNIIPCLDKVNSTFEIDDDNFYDIDKLYILPNALAPYSIARIEEDDSRILITEDFKNKCETSKLEGFNFIEILDYK